MPQEAPQEPKKARILFVDDEQRVLNSMRIMFRRQYDLFLASHGAQALDIIKEKDIDVIVADHRMPQMTGVEVLTKVRSLSPRTVRILLTGYADLDAVEGSINDGEVFRFLTKPCAPDQLRETISHATRLAQTAVNPVEDEMDDTGVEIILESDSVTQIEAGAEAPRRVAPPVPATTTTGPEAPLDHGSTSVLDPACAPRPRQAAVASSAQPRLAKGLGVIVFSSDDEVLVTVQKAVRSRLPIYHATNIVQVVKHLTDHRPGVLVTDISDDKATIQAMTARLKQHLPELVTIAVSRHRDVLDMVWLINHGQIFRFLRKPLSAGRCAISLQAALKHHRMLLKNPELIKRHAVDEADSQGLMEGVLNKLKVVRRLWVSA
jgi:serine/threonine-protein kinase